MEKTTRRVVSRSPHRTVWVLNYPDLQSQSIECESALERDFVLLASIFGGVKAICHQPFKVTMAIGGYTPDYQITFIDESSAVIEVKPSVFMAKHLEKIGGAAKEIAKSGCAFYVSDEAVIQGDRCVKQAKQIRRHAKASYPPDDCLFVINKVMAAGALTLRELVEGFKVSRELVLHLIANRRICCRDLPLSIDESVIVGPFPRKPEISYAIQFGDWIGCSGWQKKFGVQP